MSLTPQLPLRRVKAIGTVEGRLVQILECGHTVDILYVADKSKLSRRCYRCWRKEPVLQS